jgi:hypothetical protein
MMKTALLLTAFAALAAGCANTGLPETELSQEQVCLAHFENDPVERDRCRLDPKVRGETPPDVAPLELPIRTGQMGD